MANEHTLIFEKSTPIPFTCANATGIEKGTMMKLVDPMAASAHGGINQPIAGVLAEEKIASDGHIKCSIYTDGIFDATASGSITVGAALAADSVANKLFSAAVNAENIVGRALETATTGQTFRYELNPYSSNLA
jgi:hypothetical protein